MSLPGGRFDTDTNHRAWVAARSAPPLSPPPRPGFGPGMTDTAGLLTSAAVMMNFKPEYGHVDHVFSEKHLNEVELPILDWLLHEVD